MYILAVISVDSASVLAVGNTYTKARPADLAVKACQGMLQKATSQLHTTIKRIAFLLPYMLNEEFWVPNGQQS